MYLIHKTVVLVSVILRLPSRHRVIYGVESWNGVVEWSGVWSGVESTLYSCNLGRAFVVEMRNESTLKTQPQ